MKKKKDILFSIANDSEGNEVFASDAKKGESYSCCGCGGEMILRKGKIKRPHFAHKNLSSDCKPETVLHNSFIRYAAKYLSEKLAIGGGLEISWKCGSCWGDHKGNLFKKVDSVLFEKQTAGKYKPDISLLNKQGNLFAAIEIIVTHFPEEEVIRYYYENDVILIQIELKDDTDLSRVEEIISKEMNVFFCPIYNKQQREVEKKQRLESIRLKRESELLEKNKRKLNRNYKKAERTLAGLSFAQLENQKTGIFENDSIYIAYDNLSLKNGNLHAKIDKLKKQIDKLESRIRQHEITISRAEEATTNRSSKYQGFDIPDSLKEVRRLINYYIKREREIENILDRLSALNASDKFLNENTFSQVDALRAELEKPLERR